MNNKFKYRNINIELTNACTFSCSFCPDSKMRKKIKVFHLITRFIKGGADQHTLLKTIELNKRGYDIHLGFGKEYDKEQRDFIKKNNIKVKKFPLIRHGNIFTAPLAVFSVYKYIKKNKFDIIHTHSTEAGVIGRIAAKLAGTPIIIYALHGCPFSETRTKLLNWFVLKCEQIMAKFTTKIICVGDNLTKEYLSRKIGKKSQYITIRSGIDIEKFKNAKPIKAIKNNQRFNIGLIGRVTEGKGHKEAIEAMNLLKSKKAHLFIVGEGDMLNYYKNKNNNKHITFLGHRDDIENIIASLDLVILPSYREGIPRCIIEAIAAEKPIIATNIAGIPELVKDNKNGFLIPIKNSRILADKMNYLINHPNIAKKMGKKEHKKVDIFSLDKIIDDTDRLYKTMLARKNEKLPYNRC